MNKDDARVELNFERIDAQIYDWEWQEPECDWWNYQRDFKAMRAALSRNQFTTDLRAHADAFIKIAEDVDAVASGGADTISFWCN